MSRQPEGNRQAWGQQLKERLGDFSDDVRIFAEDTYDAIGEIWWQVKEMSPLVVIIPLFIISTTIEAVGDGVQKAADVTSRIIGRRNREDIPLE